VTLISTSEVTLIATDKEFQQYKENPAGTKKIKDGTDSDIGNSPSSLFSAQHSLT
jgi:hypothetical protein